MTAGRRLRTFGTFMGLALVATVAQADAPIDQYGLFDSNAEAIQDLWTGLTWQRYGPTQTFGFDAALAYCESLSLTTPTGPATGWRVPSYKELLTLVDEAPHAEYGNGMLVLTAIDSHAFPGTASAPYWSSSAFTSLGPAYYAYAVNFQDGVALKTPQSTPLNVRCVHD